MIYHYRHLASYSPLSLLVPLEKGLYVFYLYGHLAVEMFYLLSGYGLTLGNERSKNTTLSGGWSYLAPKLGRLYPLVFVTTGICLVLQLFAEHLTGAMVLGLKNYTFWDTALSMSMLQCGLFGTRVPYNVPAWFLTPLLVCYLLFYGIYFNRRKGTRFLLASLGVLLGGVLVYREYFFGF